MTTVVALARQGSVWMAADTMTNVYDRPVLGFNKVVRIAARNGHEMLLGFSGTCSLAALVDQHLSTEAPMQDVEGWANAIAQAITDIAVTHSVLDDGKMDGRVLLGCSGQLWTISHRTAIHHPDGMAAIGSGEGPALGALHGILQAAPDAVPDRAVSTACTIGVDLDIYSGGGPLLHRIVASSQSDG